MQLALGPPSATWLQRTLDKGRIDVMLTRSMLASLILHLAKLANHTYANTVTRDAITLRGESVMRHLTQLVLVGVVVLAMASIAAAQARPPVAAVEPQPVVRLGGGYIEVANDLWMHVIATADIRYSTVENRDFERRVR